MKVKYNSEIIAGSIFSIVSFVLWILIPNQIQTMETSSVNAQTFPKIAVGGMFLFSVALLLQGIFSIPKMQVIISKETIKSEEFKKEMKSVIYAIILLTYTILITFCGFIVSTIMLVVATLLFYKSKKWYYYAISCSVVFIVYYVFANVLRVSLP